MTQETPLNARASRPSDDAVVREADLIALLKELVVGIQESGGDIVASLKDACERVKALRRPSASAEHVWHKCPEPCPNHQAGRSCPYCDGGLAFCDVCKKGEAELAEACPGPSASAEPDRMPTSLDPSLEGPAEPESGVGEIVRRLEGPHEWGYRDPVVGGFIEDDAPFKAADILRSRDAGADGVECERHKQARWLAGNIVNAGMIRPTQQKWDGLYHLASEFVRMTQLQPCDGTRDAGAETQEINALKDALAQANGEIAELRSDAGADAMRFALADARAQIAYLQGFAPHRFRSTDTVLASIDAALKEAPGHASEGEG